MIEDSKTRIAAVGDIHVKEKDTGKWQKYFQELSDKADVLLLCGDLTDTGRKEEAEVLAEELEACPVPVIGVLGNHDFESGTPEEVVAVLKDKMHLLDGDSVVIGNVGFAGVKGFGGGFHRYKMPAYGEPINKTFVQVVIDESQKLDLALKKIEEQNESLKKVAVLHYAPIEETLVGEPVPIYSFLGSSYLEAPLEDNNVDLAFHGHAHAGTLKGITRNGIAVYNVAVPVLRNNGFKKPFYLLEV